MKNFNFAAYVVAIFSIVMSVFLVSCDNTTFLGVDEEIKNIPVNPGTEVVKYENMDFTAEFDTILNELYTVEEKVSGEVVTYKGDKEISRKPFAKDLDLNAKFSATPAMVYVPEEDMLSGVSLVETTNDGEQVTDESKDGFKTTTTKKNYTFTFDQNEKVNSETMWQSLSTADTLFAYARIKNVSYNNFDALLNEEKSNADSTVYDITLHFLVDVVCDKKPAIDKAYTVDVPYLRIYKNGEVPDIVETKLENEAYEAEFDTAVKELFTVRQENSGDFVTYKNGEEIQRDNWVKDINLEALFDVKDVVYVDDEAKLAQVAMTASSFDGDVITPNVDGKFTTTSRKLNYNFRFNEGETVKTATEYEALSYDQDGEDETFEYSSIKNVRYARYEAVKNEEKSNADSTVYDITLHFDVDVVREAPVSAKAGVKTRAAAEPDVYAVVVPYYRVLKHEQKDEITGKRYENVSRRILNATTEELSWTEVQIWSLSGEKSVSMEGKLYRHWTSPELQWVYTANNQYNTSSNGSSFVRDVKSTEEAWNYTTRYMQYSSTADNGDKAFNNVYSYDYQSAVYTDPDGFYTLNFDFATWTVKEIGSSVSTTSTEVEKDGIVYNVWDYLNNVNTIYTIEGDSYEGSDKAAAKIAVEKPVEDIIDGKILSMGVSAVPSDDVPNTNIARKAFCITYQKGETVGAVSIVVDMDKVVPSREEYAKGYYVNGNFTAEYNSAFYTTTTNKGSYAAGKWAPAIAKDLSDRISYYNGERCVRNIKSTTLQMWNWRGGNLSTVVDGYNFNVNGEGVATIYYNGKIVARFR